MILKAREIDIIVGDPFKNDRLDRKENAEILTEFICSSSEPMVVCIDAPWGQGKTTFLRMWEQYLKDNNVPTIYFNAWENDFTDDAFVSLIGEIGSAIETLTNKENKSKVTEYYQKAKKVGLGLVKRAIPAAAKVATAGAFDLEEITEQTLSSFAESLANEQIEKYENAKKALCTFREHLAGFANNISSENGKPLVFIIDELDRCRPTFSIEILEKAKHFFNVPNIIFVLGADKEQLGHSIKAIYGQGINVNGYLRRFIDFDYLLPSPEKGKFVSALFDKYAFDEYFSKKKSESTRYEGEQALRMFTELFEAYQLTLREQVHCCSLLSLSIRTTPSNNKLFPLFLCLLIVLKVKEPEVYKRFISGELTPNQLIEKIKQTDRLNGIFESNYGAVLEAYIAACRKYDYAGEDITAPYVRIRDSLDSQDTEKHYANRVLQILEQFEWSGGFGSLDYLVKKIEVASRFNA
ncbi:TPA: hypothetical protein RUZ56_003497 [Vibrio cholerae]|uniref:KAP family P-loop NTPase fold protein n=1 Tax=Vibrio cholerae TaxID=666 RepID=UPI0004886A67|nr:P-loop NTPase fold protein [Vibrio cholerae]ELJ8516677.1 hypothetical protein [Vibrio cholerae]TQP44553.1 hypothetical protein FLL90_16540 [Vibrio cholerae]TQP76776.1 hypothetical protein FLL89_19870 [Vibrio cholerae]HDZ9342138.1 hypothetical protein [Vibrio cholerae]